MKKGFYNILKANFLISEDAYKNWRFIVFCTVLAIIMIASSHSAEKKVHQIARLNNEVRELRSEFVERRSDLMKIKMESTITEKMVEKGIGPSETPPNKIRVIIKD
ncbi:FtsL-like putative cell division protein [Gramella jeungdoensis]|uniref:FtsL-like putative cell division protein n=1 Tax=Gramella jeungdoensis TaxID=708091 RepID=A0ABT0YWP0_9FLAO|nr:FtsL-like putative cell division protein [Gramella jeungdoensis]MCM8567871.1 FtsL-like putative cell division protein [Gramella jeungdoensis]MDX1542445.1 FtsL-like putative cell division protein [Christiangramia sp.]